MRVDNWLSACASIAAAEASLAATGAELVTQQHVNMARRLNDCASAYASVALLLKV